MTAAPAFTGKRSAAAHVLWGYRRMEVACCVCSVQTAKYRCPSCRLRYCSLTCCKKHKDVCATKEAPDFPKCLAKAVAGNNTLHNKVDEFLDEDEESDRVPLQKLKMLGESSELKDLLLNPHVRKMVSTLDQTENKAQMLQQYMQEPLFVEFADKCLSIVTTEEKENLLRV